MPSVCPRDAPKVRANLGGTPELHIRDSTVGYFPRIVGELATRMCEKNTLNNNDEDFFHQNTKSVSKADV